MKKLITLLVLIIGTGAVTSVLADADTTAKECEARDPGSSSGCNGFWTNSCDITKPDDGVCQKHTKRGENPHDYCSCDPNS